jgi:hypothetical protein
MSQETCPPAPAVISDYAVHSDFLVHWTGWDLDCEYDPNWHCCDKSSASDPLCEEYVARLRSTLQFGLWLTERSDPPFRSGDQEICIPTIPKVCFTELKLSESRHHARRYGRLGIGVKRPYLFDRLGRPLAYFGYATAKNNDAFLRACASDLTDQRLLNFFKPMNSDADQLNYDLYSESEWRILFLPELPNDKRLIDPRDPNDVAEHAFFNSRDDTQRDKLKYLAPLNGWLALIIYPSVNVKNMAQQDLGIIDAIRRIKSKRDDPGNRVEEGNWPIEIDLDACRNF